MKILVVGESCIDRFVYGFLQDRKCPEAPAFILSPNDTIENDGMAANTQANVRSLGVKCDIITNSENIIKERFVETSSNYLLLRVDHNEDSIERVKRKDIGVEKISQYDAIIISDYNKGFLDEEDIEYICENHKLTFLDTKKALGNFCLATTYININNFEYTKSQSVIDEAAFYEKLVITLGPKGCQYKDNIYPVEKIEVIDQVGAGDTFIAALAVKFLENNQIDQSIEFANFCATKAVKKKGVVAVKKES
jgi:D-beta-D-heptose 7-phosphate kinase/D-beta-D-heptose 1-phosphate adenosyltransferase